MPMYAAQNYSHLLGTKGFSDEALELHFGLYEGYVQVGQLPFARECSKEKPTSLFPAPLGLQPCGTAVITAGLQTQRSRASTSISPLVWTL